MPLPQNQRFQFINDQLRRGRAVPASVLMQGCESAERTLKEDLALMRERYDAPIRYNRRRNGYEYTYAFDLKTVELELTDQDVVALKRALATLNQFRDWTVFADFRGAVEKIEQAVRFRFAQPADSQAHIIFEAVPAGRGNDLLDQVLVACLQKKVIQFRYQKYQDSESRLRTVFPHLIKEHRNRWYVIGHEVEPTQLRVFGLDRVVDGTLEITDLSFDPPAFDAEAYFRPALGVAVYDDPPEEVILSFSREEGLRFQAQPFYPFRKEDILVNTNKEFRVRLSIIINKELEYELARLGDTVRVISPEKLIHRLAKFHKRALKLYAKK
ncbi:YafY family protein [Siphonobacter sp. SORGH_AS_1065]|uniref:helix-turn-helix transcriptional regulator n=1 Tax=Siphonobacter sp. SORGH_AS_1065 TaxID=3041795 RepID=UPI00277E5912|nr:WYL domain-containing protein [Siphonobacter sp. SORGH_AS_1065]MDQ1089904.1 putative DNA-binding transcriptional regulator YafY [Siphonobacter sp. SORGH_AS_1065]